MKIAFEQAVYGSFPFWDKGYATLARSAGCRDEWLADFKHLCQSLGQPPNEATPRVNQLILAKKLPSGPWLVCQGSAQGCDDRGRPGAWAFHGLFLSGRDYRRAGATPFAFRSVFLDQFQPDLKLNSKRVEMETPGQTDISGILSFRPDLLKWISRGLKFRLLTDNPADLYLLEALWSQVPASTRRNRSIATWVFRSEADFHLAALGPARMPADSPCKNREIWALTPNEMSATDEIAAVDRPFKRFLKSKKKAILFPVIGLVLAVGVGSCVTCDRNSDDKNNIADITNSDNKAQLPLKSRFESLEEPANVKMAIQEQLADWCERLEIPKNGEPGRTLQTVQQISNSVQYQGPSVYFFSKEPGLIGLEGVIDRCSAVRPIPDEIVTTHPDSDRYSLAVLAWSVGAIQLQSESEKIQNPADARRWFEQLRDFVIPENVKNWINSSRPELKGPEWAEARLHLLRLLRIRGE